MRNDNPPRLRFFGLPISRALKIIGHSFTVESVIASMHLLLL